jgi:hypothetical protein
VDWLGDSKHLLDVIPSHQDVSRSQVVEITRDDDPTVGHFLRPTSGRLELGYDLGTISHDLTMILLDVSNNLNDSVCLHSPSSVPFFF